MEFRVVYLLLLFSPAYTQRAEDVTTLLNEFCFNCFCGAADKTAYCNSYSFTSEMWQGLIDFDPKTLHFSSVSRVFVNVTVMPQLSVETLILSDTDTENIESASFSKLRKMRVLVLKENKLTAKLNPRAFEGKNTSKGIEPLSSMRVLDLSVNAISSVNPDWFMYLPELTSLNLNGNPLATIDHNTEIAISRLPKLKELLLSYCRLKEIPAKFFHSSRYLEHLDLGGNQFTSIPQALEEAPELVYLILNNNPIVELDMNKENAKGFPRLNKLEILYMYEMPNLTRIGAGGLAGLTGLSKLYMHSNPKLREIDPMAMARLDASGKGYTWPPIKVLYIDSNNLSTVPRNFLARWDQLQQINVGYNPFVCDCSVWWILHELVELLTTKYSQHFNEMVCAAPPELKGNGLMNFNSKHLQLACDHPQGAVLISILVAVSCLWKRGNFRKRRATVTDPEQHPMAHIAK